MLHVLGSRDPLGGRATRRQLLQAGGVGLCGLTLADVLRWEHARAVAAPNSAARPGKGKARSCIVLFLYGAWSQLDTLDPKPDAPSEIRGEFQPIATSVPGLAVCEHLPRMARWMDRVALVRSLSHPYPTHCVAYALSGIPQNPLRDPREYWPFYGSTLDYLWDRLGNDGQPAGVPRNMCLPFPLNSHSDNRSHRGLTAAWLGQAWESVFGEFAGRAAREEGFPSARGDTPIRSRLDPFDGVTPDSTFRFMAPTVLKYAPQVGTAHQVARSGLDLPAGLTVDHLQSRRDLLARLDRARRAADDLPETASYDRFRRMAFDMITAPACAAALDVTGEPEAVRARYGYTLFGQGALAARRLVEAGVRVVTVYWDEYGPANTAWDTHSNNFPRLREGLCPTLDQVYTALLEDLDQRGLLDETLVLLLSEHGRTPHIASKPGGGREHWSYAYCGVLAGAGIGRGALVGATDQHAAYPARRPLSPKDILATLYHLVGFDPQTTRTFDSLDRPHPLLPHGEVIGELLA